MRWIFLRILLTALGYSLLGEAVLRYAESHPPATIFEALLLQGTLLIFGAYLWFRHHFLVGVIDIPVFGEVPKVVVYVVVATVFVVLIVIILRFLISRFHRWMSLFYKEKDPREDHTVTRITMTLSRALRQFQMALKRSPGAILLGVDGTKTPLVYKAKLRTYHTQIIGKTGSGKSVLIQSMLYQDLLAGRGAIVIDGKGEYDFANSIYQMAAELGRDRDFRFFSLAYPERSEAYNPLRMEGPEDVSPVAQRVFAVCESDNLYYQEQAENFFKDVVALLYGTAKDFNLADVYRCVVDPGALQNIAKESTDQAAWLRLTSQLEGLADRVRMTLSGLESWMRKFSAIEPLNRFPCNEGLFLRSIIANNEIAYFQLPAAYQQTLVRAVGKLLLQDIQMEIARRQIFDGKRPYFPVYIDEFYNFVYEGFIPAINEGRSSNIMWHLCHQSMSDLRRVSPEFEEAIWDNTRNKIILSQNNYRLCDRIARHDFTAIWTPERHFHSFGGLFPNPSVLSAYLAAITERIRLRAGSVVIPTHHPVRVAEEWAVVDNLSQGRVDIAFARGWNPNDFVLAPENYAHSTELLFSGIETVKQLWRGESIRLSNGKGEEAEVRIYPRPKQPELAVWVTCSGGVERFAEAGALGANVLTALLFQSVDDLGEKIAAYRAARSAHGHDPAAGVVTCMMHTAVGADLETVRQQVRAPFIAYLKNSVNLWRQGSTDLNTLSPTEQAALLEYAFERYFQQSALFGTPRSCLPMVQKLAAVGVNEIACLIDFGIDADTVLANLPALNDLRLLTNRTRQIPSAQTNSAAWALRESKQQRFDGGENALTHAINGYDAPKSDAIPETAQKLRRQFLTASEEERYSQICGLLLQLVADTLNREMTQLDEHESVNSLGIDSLMAVRLKGRIQEQLGVEFPATMLLDGVTIAQLAQQFNAQLAEADDVKTINSNSAKSAEKRNGAAPHLNGGAHRNGMAYQKAVAEKANPIPAEHYRFDDFPEYRNILQMRREFTIPNPYFRPHEGINTATTVIDGWELINFSSYNYLGMSGDPVVSDATKMAIDHYGTSVSASRLISGEIPPHQALEQALADLLGVEDSLVYLGGHATNVTTIGHLMGSNDLILYDEWSHNSILQGNMMAGATARTFPTMSGKH